MTDHISETVLNDLVDSPDPVTHAAALGHVAHCDVCRARFESLRDLRAALGSLPRDVAPPPELLHAIHGALDNDGPHTEGMRSSQRSASWRLRTPALLAAAAAVLVLASSLITAALLRDDAPPAAGVPQGANGATRLVAHPLETSYERAIAELQRELAAGDAVLSAETRRIVELNLDIIDRALAEAREALLADPANAALADVLRSGYERKLDVLRSAATHVRPAS